MDLVTKVTNLIQGGNRSLSHRKFIAFLDEINAAYGDLQIYILLAHKIYFEFLFVQTKYIFLFSKTPIAPS